MTAYPFTPSDAEERIKESIKPVEFKFSDFGTGFMDENLPAIAIDYLMNHQDFPADENYNPKQDHNLDHMKIIMIYLCLVKVQLSLQLL